MNHWWSEPQPWNTFAFFRRAPLAPVALLVALGVWLGSRTPGGMPVWLAAGTLLLGLGLWRGGAVRAYALGLAALALGAGRAGLDYRSAGRLAGHLDRPRENLDLVFRVTGEPTPLFLRSRGSSAWLVPARIEVAHRTTTPLLLDAEVSVRVVGDLPPGVFEYGNRLRAPGVLERREGPGAMLWPADYRFSLLDAADARVVATGQGSRFVAACLRLRARAAGLLADPGEAAAARAAVLRALTLGMRGEISQEINDLFARTGTLHILAVSGLHVVIIGGLLLFFVRWTPLPRPYWGLVLIPALLVFVCATGLKASSVRAWIMAATFGVAPLIWRKPDSRTSLAASAVIILAISPRQLFDLGFQFSFLSMVAMIGLGNLLDTRLRAWTEPDPFTAPLQPARPPLRLRLARSFLSFLALNLAAWSITAPLTANVFHISSPVAALANLLVVPLSTLVTWLGFLSLVAGSVWPLLGGFFQTAGLFTVRLMLGWADLTHRLPGAWQYVEAPPAWFHWLFMAGFAAVVVRQRLDRWALGWGLAVGLALAGLARERRAARDLWVLNQDGVAVVIGRTAGSRGLVADPGGRFYGTRLLESLRAKGLDHLDVWCGAIDSRRAGVVPELATAFRVRRVLAPEGGSASLRAELGALEVPVSTPAAGTPEFVRDLLAEPFFNTDSDALAARFSREGLGLLWLGAVAGGEEGGLRPADLAPSAPVTVANASAGAGALPDAFLAAVRPRALVVCRSDFAEARRALQPALDRWVAAGWRVIELENGGELRLDLTSPSLNEFLPPNPVMKD